MIKIVVMRKFKVILICMLMAKTAYTQDMPDKGNFSLGMRSTSSLFSSEDAKFGSGAGGQFRIQFTNRINSDWFADYITTNIANAGRRIDAHIGWSVLFYPFLSESKLQPYVIAGHCFDYTRIQAFSTPYTNNSLIDTERWSSAVQMGLGSHFRLTERFDLSFNAQYMIHIGNDVHAHVVESIGGINTLEITEEKGAGVEGHILLTFSVNYIIADLW